jgi:N-methylhydantoinase A
VLEPSEAVKVAALERRFRPLVAAARRELLREGFARKRQVVACHLDLRYIGQSYEITVPFGPAYRRAFDRRHERLYGYANRARPTEIVNLRVTATGLTEKPKLPFTPPRRAFAPRPADRRPGRFGGRSVTVSFHQWEALAPGAAGAGPAVITGGEATAVIPPGFRFHVDGFGNLVARS